MNIIRQKEDGWYFIDETWSDEYGPYKTERKAKRKLKKYGKRLNKIDKKFFKNVKRLYSND